MPKQAEYTLTWSKDTSGYVIEHGPLSFCLNGNADLLFWLERVETVHFVSRFGHTVTLRKEQKQRGSGYWYAYKRVNGKVQKKYLGDKNKVTLAGLEAIARQFADPATASPPPPKQKRAAPKREQATPKREEQKAAPPPPRKPTLVFTNNLQSALHIYGFASPPNKKVLVDRYRDLSKQYHPDRGGLHEDMVAVNLAYDYLKKFL